MYDLSALEKIGEGRLSIVYKLDGGKLLKVFKYPDVAGYEYRQTTAVWQAGVSAQQPHALTVVDGRDAIVYDYLDGDLLMDCVSRDKAHILRHLDLMAQCQATIIRGVCDALPSGREGLAHAIRHAPRIGEDCRNILLKRLEAMPEGNHVLHGDLHPLNIIVTGGVPNAIDWMTGSRGDPAADIARSYFILRYSVLKEDRGILDAVRRTLMFGFLGQYYLSRVLRRSGLKRRDVLRWLPFVAAGRLTEQRPETEERIILKIVGRFCGAGG